MLHDKRWKRAFARVLTRLSSIIFFITLTRKEQRVAIGKKGKNRFYWEYFVVLVVSCVWFCCFTSYHTNSQSFALKMSSELKGCTLLQLKVEADKARETLIHFHWGWRYLFYRTYFWSSWIRKIEYRYFKLLSIRIFLSSILKTCQLSMINQMTDWPS